VKPYVAFVGRVSPEKGAAELIEAARCLPDVPIQIAGDYSRMPQLVETAPDNVTFRGQLDADALRAFYRGARLVVLPSVCFEGFPGVIVEAMQHAKPVACSRIGGLPEIVDDNVTGALFAPGDPADIAAKTQRLYRDPDLCQRLGAAGRAKAQRDFSPERYCQKLEALYARALQLGPGGPS
jgi:glycosyltransferase involved in cell wall biosynthesis